MDEGYPTADEEFELMYGDELELLREQENFNEPVPKTRRTLEFSTPANNIPKVNSEPSDYSKENSNPNTDGINDLNNSFERDFTPIQQSQESNSAARQVSHSSVGTNKRAIEQLFGDIDDILSEGVTGYYGPVSKRHKQDKEKADLALIQHIVELRNISKNRENPAAAFGKDYTKKITERDKLNLSYRVPKFPFIGITRHDGQRVYIRFHSEEYEQEETRRVASKNSFTGVMGDLFKEIWKEATGYINKEFEETEDESQSSEITVLETDENKNLWVDLYKPKKYLELLSDESTNRTLLKWLKLWDKVVFNRKPKIKPVKVDEHSKNFKFLNRELSLKLGEDGRPEYKVALLCGPPGLGKTTLAHMVAKHAGYNVVEINASDDRNTDNFKLALENATSMRSVLDKEKRPNCLVFDEIDGAPRASIDFLIKYINGTHIPKTKKGKNQTSNILKRPIICICNDIYVPALRQLRQIAFVINFPPIKNTRLAERLNEICRRQQIKTDMGALLALSEKTNNDIRACLSVLHFFKSQNKPVTLSVVMKSSVGQKDMQKGLFAVWQEIFQIERPKQKNTSNENSDNQQKVTQYTDTSLRSRMHKIIDTVNSFGDYERLMQGVFENYPSMNIKDSSLVSTCEAMEWFCFNDIVNKKIMGLQEYSLTTYLQYGFVIWHFVFASSSWQKINFPSVGSEVRSKIAIQNAILNEVLKGMQPSVRTYLHPSSLKLEILPYLTRIVVPLFRPVNLHLYTQKEKDELINVVSTMIDYNLSYAQERTLEGNYVYNIDPNVEEITQFGGAKPPRNLSYANKQMIAREIELEKMRRFTGKNFSSKVTMQKKKETEKQDNKQLPNHLQKLKPNIVKPKESTVCKDFFGRIISKPASESGKGGPDLKHDIWYQYKEGYTNAVRKKIKIKNLK